MCVNCINKRIRHRVSQHTSSVARRFVFSDCNIPRRLGQNRSGNCNVKHRLHISNIVPSPRITNDFHSLSDASWYTSAYLLTTTTLQPTWGKVYQSFAVKSVFTVVMSFVMIGSLVCATAKNTTIFIIGRAIAGVGAGGVFSESLTITAYTVPLYRRPKINGALTSLF